MLDLGFCRKATSLEEAVILAKEVSFSLSDSYLPSDAKGFREFDQNHSPEDFHFGEPKCEILDTDGHDVFVYTTSRGKVTFTWSDVNETVFVDLTSERECLAESTAFTQFTGSGWEMYRHFIWWQE